MLILFQWKVNKFELWFLNKETINFWKNKNLLSKAINSYYNLFEFEDNYLKKSQ